MKLWWLILAGAISLPAGVIQGVTLDWASGRPLSRTIVHLQPIPGTGNKPLQTRSGRSGQFLFSKVPPGLYILETQREGFLPAAFGQRRPTGHGTPIPVTSDSSLFAELRVHRMGAITGTILDENGIGIPRINVVAYRARLPLRSVAQGTTDDRGVFRISGLELGKHWVRNAAHTLDDGSSLLPMFGPEVREPRDALIHEVRFDNDTPDANIRPEPGTLATLSVAVGCDRPQDTPVQLVLTSETMKKTTDGICGGRSSFTGLPPAVYEIFATYRDNSGSGFAELSVHQNMQTTLQVLSTSPVNFEIVNAANRSPLRTPVKLYGRRDDLSGAGPFIEIPIPRAPLPPGHWEFTAVAGPGQYVANIQSEGRENRRPWRAVRPPEGFPVYVEPWRAAERVRIFVSERAAQLAGAVTSEGKRAAGMPVYLLPVTEDARRMLGGSAETITDVDGAFRFPSLPPGAYRIVATMDIRELTPELADEAQAKSITLNEGQVMSVELGLHQYP
ncbi:MAG: carboxypeptidase regulatory-like domain-containing protein [Acidobacteria bacterium]|nr:carboxypeptidase regulatory-like domain-containing protein [Acidobacteriota bacterium]